jgi:phospholipid/cholesterol/gamma-HCH transport system substrate-binding protein
MDLHYKQELQVGFLVLVALAFLIGGLIWLSGATVSGRGRVTFGVRFESIQGLTGGDPVQISGVSVGRVAAIQLEDVGRVIVTLEVSERVRPRLDARASVRALDFLGAKYVEYQPGKADSVLPEGSVIAGETETDIAATANTLAERAEALMARGAFFLSEEMATQVRQTLAAAERALDVVSRTSDGSVLAEATAALRTLAHTAARLDTLLANPGLERSLAQMDEVTQSLGEMSQGLALVTTSLGSVLAKVDSAQGSLGLAVNDSTLHNDLHEVLLSLRKLLDDVRENPGRYGPRSIKLF